MHAVKEFFTSRYDDGYLVEFDFSQLEIRVLAELSGCKNLLKDLELGLDMHCKSASLLYSGPYHHVKEAVDAGDPVWIRRRREGKTVSFQFNYGASDASISKSTKVPTDRVKEYRQNYNSEYPEVQEFIIRNTCEIEGSKVPTGTKNGYQLHEGYLKLITGRELCFKQEVDKYKGGTRFSRQQIMNYPIQAIAADIVDVAWVQVCKFMENETGCVIDTIHDSILCDLPDLSLVPYIQDVLEYTRERFEEVYDVEWKSLLPVDVKFGKNWASMEKYV